MDRRTFLKFGVTSVAAVKAATGLPPSLLSRVLGKHVDAPGQDIDLEARAKAAADAVVRQVAQVADYSLRDVRWGPVSVPGPPRVGGLYQLLGMDRHLPEHPGRRGGMWVCEHVSGMLDRQYAMGNAVILSRQGSMVTLQPVPPSLEQSAYDAVKALIEGALYLRPMVTTREEMRHVNDLDKMVKQLGAEALNYWKHRNAEALRTA